MLIYRFIPAKPRLQQPHAVLVNTARAALVNEQALRQALERGTIAGAGFDVYWQEPLPVDHCLRQQNSVVLQSHVGGFTEEGYVSLLAPAIANVMAFLDGRPQCLINPSVSRRQQPA